MLTQKQEAFVAKYLETGNATQAYRHAYNTENTSDVVIHKDACNLLKNRKVAVRIKEVKDKVLEAIVIDRKFVTQGILNNIQDAESDGDRSNALKGYDMLGKMYDLNEDKQNDRLVSNKDRAALVENYKRRMLDVTPD